MKLFHTLWITLALVGGCSANHLIGDVDGGTGNAGTGNAGTGNAGNGNGGTGGTATQTDAGAPALEASAPLEPPVGPVQTWTGYVENFTFASGSDALVITVGMDSQGRAAGTVVIGQGTPPAPATDPNVGYPPAAYLPVGHVDPFEVDSFVWVEGYAYPFDDGALTSQRLHFTANLEQLWAGWCALEKDAEGTGRCLPATGGTGPNSEGMCGYPDPKTSTDVPVDCTKLALCALQSPCVCNEAGCALRSVELSTNTLSIDIAVDGSTASGNLIANFGNHSVHLTRSP